MPENDEYKVSWAYIVRHMESDYGIKPNSTKKLYMKEIEQKLDEIWFSSICKAIKRNLEKQRREKKSGQIQQ